MPTAFLTPPAHFVGRDEYVARFKARLEHYNFFLYDGIPGIGKTALLRRLAKETKAVGVKESVFLQLVPGEGVASIVARCMAGDKKLRGSFTFDRQADLFGRLIDVLNSRKLVVILDGVQNLRREEFPALVRALRNAKGPFRVLATLRGGEPELSAMDRMLLHQERVGPLAPDEVKKLAQSYKISSHNLEILMADAARGGAVAQPLTLRTMLSLCGNELPPKELLDQQSARSVNAFKAILTFAENKLSEAEREALGQLGALGQPLGRKAAVKIFGAAVTKLLNRGLVDEIDGDVYVHQQLASYFASDKTLSNRDAVAVAGELRERAQERSEPLSVIRAGKLLAQAGRPDDAVEILAEGWEAVRDLGFLEAYLRILASIDPRGSLGPRLQLLSARARMRQGSPLMVKDELERLSQEKDGWTKVRALAALVSVYDQLDEHPKVVQSFQQLRKMSAPPDLLMPAGSLAATAMLRLGQVSDAEKLGKELLGRLKSGRDLERHGELHRTLSQVYQQMGQLAKAVEEAQLAAKAFVSAGDHYHAASVYGFIGDLYRETGDFELAQEAFKKFFELAQKAGDKNLLHIAELAEAWVALDVGDLTSAQRRITQVEKEISATANRRLKRYLAAARALLEAGRGHHEAAVEMLPRITEQWEQAGQHSIADHLRAQLVRSLLALGKVDEASQIADTALSRLDPKIAAPRVAAFLRESALIKLKRKDPKRALADLTQAIKLFAQGGNRREEAHTIYRLAHAALDEGDVTLAAGRAHEALELARKIKHTRVVALAREIEGRIALMKDDPKAAIAATKEAMSALKRLGDEIGSLHVAASLLRAQVVAGDLAGAIRLGPKVSEQADALEMREVRIRTIALTGVALLRKGRPDAAARCFRELPQAAASAGTVALMWRFGEALALAGGDKQSALDRREKWVASVKRMPEVQQDATLHSLAQLQMPPRDRAQLRTPGGVSIVGSEQVGWLDPLQYQFFVDMVHHRAFAAGKPLAIPGGEVSKLFTELVVVSPEPLTYENAGRALFKEEPDKKVESKVKPVLKELNKILKGAKDVSIEAKNGSMRLVSPKKFAFIVPTQRAATDLTGEQRKILQLVRKLGAAPLQSIESTLKLEKGVAKKTVDGLVKNGLLESVRDGRGQAFRLA